MGGLLTYLYYGANQPDPVTGLTPKERYLIKSTWDVCRKDLPSVGMELFYLYFKEYPDYHNLFPFKGVPLDKLKHNVKLKAHATSVAYALSSIVENIDKPEILLGVLHKTAEIHARKNIHNKAFEDLKVVTVKLLQASFGLKFTKDHRDAWEKALEVAFKVVLNNIEEELRNQ